MKVPVSWLREYVEFDWPLDVLARKLVYTSCEVDRIVRRGVPDVDGNLGLFRVGKVVEAEKHPNADRLQLCRVDVGESEPRQIVCGAWNFGAGATVAVALPGALLPGADSPLAEAKLRGELSRGMILSERELELGADHAGIMVLADGLEPGAALADVLPLGETVLEIETGFNRPDLTSVYGIAREVAAVTGGVLAAPPGIDPPRAAREAVEIEVHDRKGCPRYIGRLFRDVDAADSPPWLKGRLLAAGMRPISNVVDVTNYVMLALGNPLHAFDHARLAGGRIVVRRAEPGEELTTLDGQVRKLDPADLMIADGSGSVAIAGIMGGEETEVRPETTTVLLEAANFDPLTVLRSTRRLHMRTEGSTRWEKGVDPHLAEQAARLATQLLVELAGARWSGETEVRGELPARPVVRLRPQRTNDLVGLEIPTDDQRQTLEAIGFEVAPDFTVTVPTWRSGDVTREADLIEEVARFHLEEVPSTLPRREAMFGRLSPHQRLRRLVEDALVGAGFFEAYTYSLVPDGEEGLRLEEPLSAEHAVLRTDLRLGLVQSARRNLDLGAGRIALFELAHVYLPGENELPREPWHVAGIVDGGFFAAKGAAELVYEVARVAPALARGSGRSATTGEGVIEELDDGLGYFELDLDALLERAPAVTTYEDVVTFPAVKQDIAFAVDEHVAAGELAAAAREAAGAALREFRPFDVYRGEQVGPGRKSIAFAAAFQSPDRTLSDEDAAVLRQRIVDELARRFGAELRA